MNTLERWHEIIKQGKPELLDDILAEDCVFFSPVVHTPQRGRELTRLYLTGAMHVLSTDFHYVKEVVSEEHAVLEFVCEIDGISVNGVDIMSFDKGGQGNGATAEGDQHVARQDAGNAGASVGRIWFRHPLRPLWNRKWREHPMNLLMRTAPRLLFLLVALGLAACSERNSEMSGEPAAVARIEGSVMYLERIMLPPGVEVEVQLQDISRADAGATLLSSVLLRPTGGPPYKFAIEYDIRIAIHNHGHRDFGQMMPCRQHLRTDQNINFFLNVLS